MRQQPPSSTLFPYTTLFRSEPRPPPVVARVDQDYRVAAPAAVTGAIGTGIGRIGDDEEAAADRKSTRLNSSHVEISYAVFCLKKKISSMMPVTAPSASRKIR